MRAITFPKTSEGVWTNRETGVKIERYGNGYRAFRPALGVSTGTIGICREVPTLAQARDAALIYAHDVARPAISEAYVEAVAEHVERAVRAAEAVGAPTWRGTSARRMVGYAKTGAPGWLTSVINDVRRLEESTANHRSSSPEDDAARADQLYAWGIAHSCMLYDDAITADHTDALAMDRGYPSGQSRNWREQVYRRAVEMDAAAPHMGHAADALIDEAHAEALTEDLRRLGAQIVADVLADGRPLDERLQAKRDAARLIAATRAPRDEPCVSNVTGNHEYEPQGSRRNDAGTCGLPFDHVWHQGSAGLPEVPADVNDDGAWAAYCAALPQPTDQEIADVLDEYGDPYAAPRAEAVRGYKNVARVLWRMRADVGRGNLSAEIERQMRSAMRTFVGVIEVYDDLTEAWRIGNRADANRDAATQTF